MDTSTTKPVGSLSVGQAFTHPVASPLRIYFKIADPYGLLRNDLKEKGYIPAIVCGE